MYPFLSSIIYLASVSRRIRVCTHSALHLDEYACIFYIYCRLYFNVHMQDKYTCIFNIYCRLYFNVHTQVNAYPFLSSTYVALSAYAIFRKRAPQLVALLRELTCDLMHIHSCRLDMQCHLQGGEDPYDAVSL